MNKRPELPFSEPDGALSLQFRRLDRGSLSFRR